MEGRRGGLGWHLNLSEALFCEDLAFEIFSNLDDAEQEKILMIWNTRNLKDCWAGKDYKRN